MKFNVDERLACYACFAGTGSASAFFNGLADSGSIRRRCHIRRRPSRAAEAYLHRSFDSLGFGPRDPSLDRLDRRIDRDPCRDRDIRRGRRVACLDPYPGRPGLGPRRSGASASRDPSRARRPWTGLGRFVDLAVAGHSGQMERAG